jgi:hypothetical protein
MLPNLIRVLNFVLGAAILGFGRRLFWVCVGILGFLAGADLATFLAAGEPTWTVIGAAMLAGAAGAAIALFLQRLVFGLIGLLGGGYLAIKLAHAMQWDNHLVLLALAGAALGGLITVTLRDWALIAVSSLVGAAAVVVALDFQPALKVAIFLALALAGATLQGRQLRRERLRAKD